MDLFTGTAAVADHYKDRYQVIANDVMHYSAVIAAAKLSNSSQPKFERFKQRYGSDPLTYLNNLEFEPSEHYFIYNNYTSVAERNYFTKENALKIDGIRIFIEEQFGADLIDGNEYNYLLACLLEATQKVANTSGTFQAFLKYLEPRARKPISLQPLTLENAQLYSEQNKITNIEANVLARQQRADIAYIDPPYTATQYANSYHILETIAKYDNPTIFGKTGRRKNRYISHYSNKQHAIAEFEDLFRQLQCKHVLISYSNQSIVPIDEVVELAKRFAVNNVVHIEKCQYREYSTNNRSYKRNGENLEEALIYFIKDTRVNKSPLNYSGSKDELLIRMLPHFPKHISTFVDAMGGAFNVGANVVAENVLYNESNPKVFEIVQYLLSRDSDDIIAELKSLRRQFGLQKADKLQYLAARDAYNLKASPQLLFLLQVYSFQNMIRFNRSGSMNTPVGNNELNDGILSRMRNFKPRTKQVYLSNRSYDDIDYSTFDTDTLFYFDPPYFLSTAEYNDGSRGHEGWNADSEVRLLSYLNALSSKGYKFMLSNVIQHKGNTHHLLSDWIQEHGYSMFEMGLIGRKYPRREVLITNFRAF